MKSSEALGDFSEPEKYDALLNSGVGLSGENRDYFLKGRVKDLKHQLPDGFVPTRILDYGCGTGESSQLLAQVFSSARVVGSDLSEETIAYARSRYEEPSVQFCTVPNLPTSSSFDLCYCNGVFHHIPPDERSGVLRSIRAILRPGGCFALFENNPWNPGTRLIMKRIPFDRDAQTLSPRHAHRLLGRSGFSVSRPRFLFYFPRPLSWFRPLETNLVRLPLGAQYWLLGRVQSATNS